MGVPGNLVLGGVSDEALLFSEGYVGGGGVETLIVGDDLNFVVNPDTHARIGGAQVNSDASHFCSVLELVKFINQNQAKLL